MSINITNQHRLIIIIVSIVVLQVVLVGFFGFKPSIKTGYYTPQATDVKPPVNLSLSEQRRRELEAILLPPPILSWSNQSDTDELSDNLISEDVLLSFAAPKAGDSVRQNDQNRQSTALATVPPKAVPDADPQVSDEGIIFEEGKRLKVAPVYLKHLPDLQSLDTAQRKRRFVAIVLPLILRANIELDERRRLIIKAVNDGNVPLLHQWAELYRLETKSDDIEELSRQLLLRVDRIPPSLALAQSAIESGWGTSRFALQGNALFGQWAWSNDQGIKPTDARYENVVVRSFSNLFDSVRAYMHNLNTHHSYENFRRLRQIEDIETRALIGTLNIYSEEREVYVDKLSNMIDSNNFIIYDNAELLAE